MSRLHISGQVTYNNGLPAKNASVKIIDQDDHSRDDVILTASTDSNGKFTGTSSEWKDEPDGFWPWDPHDSLSLTFTVTDSVGRTHSGPFFIFPWGGSIPIVLPFGNPVMNPEHRALLVLSDLSSKAKGMDKYFYEFVERSGNSLVSSILGSSYSEIKILGLGEATVANFISNLKRLTNISRIWEVDLIVFLHGETNTLCFSDRNISTRLLREQIENAGISKSRIRMVYSTACFGSSHADDFVSAGFNAASGAKGINTNAAIELTQFLTKWKDGKNFGACIDESENLIGSAFFDSAARLIYPNRYVNSDKDVFGDRSTSINSY